jgi:hypothetical protein
MDMVNPTDDGGTWEDGPSPVHPQVIAKDKTRQERMILRDIKNSPVMLWVGSRRRLFKLIWNYLYTSRISLPRLESSRGDGGRMEDTQVMLEKRE